MEFLYQSAQHSPTNGRNERTIDMITVTGVTVVDLFAACEADHDARVAAIAPFDDPLPERPADSPTLQPALRIPRQRDVKKRHQTDGTFTTRAVAVRRLGTHVRKLQPTAKGTAQMPRA